VAKEKTGRQIVQDEAPPQPPTSRPLQPDDKPATALSYHRPNNGQCHVKLVRYGNPQSQVQTIGGRRPEVMTVNNEYLKVLLRKDGTPEITTLTNLSHTIGDDAMTTKKAAKKEATKKATTTEKLINARKADIAKDDKPAAKTNGNGKAANGNGKAAEKPAAKPAKKATKPAAKKAAANGDAPKAGKYVGRFIKVLDIVEADEDDSVRQQMLATITKVGKGKLVAITAALIDEIKTTLNTEAFRGFLRDARDKGVIEIVEKQ
jgi:hypothetical protein